MNLKSLAKKSGHTQQFRRPKSFLQALTPLASGVGDWVSRKFRLTHWENIMGTMHNWLLWDKSSDQYLPDAQCRCGRAVIKLKAVRWEHERAAENASLFGGKGPDPEIGAIPIKALQRARAKLRDAFLEHLLAKNDLDRLTRLAREEQANRTHRPDPSGGTTRAPSGVIEPTEKVTVLTEQESQAIVKKTRDRMKVVAKDMLTDKATKMALFETASPADKERERKVGEKLMKIHQDALREVQDNPTTANILELIVTIEPIQLGVTSAYDPESDAKTQVAFEAAAANKLLSRAKTALDKDPTVTNRWTAAKMSELAQLLGAE